MTGVFLVKPPASPSHQSRGAAWDAKRFRHRYSIAYFHSPNPDAIIECLNVILEMGMLLASLTRERVAILQQGYIEHPSDVAGIIYIPFNNHVKEAVPKLVGRFNAVGIHLDPAKVAETSA